MRGLLGLALAVACHVRGTTAVALDDARQQTLAAQQLHQRLRGSGVSALEQGAGGYGFSSASDEGMSAFMLTICQDPGAAEWFSRVVAPLGWQGSRILKTDLIPVGFSRENIYASSARLLSFGWCSEADGPNNGNDDEQEDAVDEQWAKDHPNEPTGPTEEVRSINEMRNLN